MSYPTGNGARHPEHSALLFEALDDPEGPPLARYENPSNGQDECGFQTGMLRLESQEVRFAQPGKFTVMSGDKAPGRLSTIDQPELTDHTTRPEAAQPGAR